MYKTKIKLPYQEFIIRNAFPIIVIAAFFMAFWVKGFIFAGMFMGIMITIAIWLLIVKLPKWMKALMGRHILMSDLLLTIGSAGILSTIGPGPTVVMASATEASLLSVLLRSLKE
jgi:hypothetical protein